MSRVRQLSCGGDEGNEALQSGEPVRQADERTGTTYSNAFDSESAELLHGLNNVFVTMLLNAQVLEWKLPSYSRLKRNLHEIERNAQRG
jgi:hypothetical protein